jgi:hypothetical protein
VPRFHGIEGCSAQRDKKADKKIGMIRKVEGTAERGVEGLGEARLRRGGAYRHPSFFVESRR